MNESNPPLRALGLLVAVKTVLLALPLGFLQEDAGHLLIAGFAMTGLIGMLRHRAWGVAALACALTLRVLITLPHTLNHAWFELLVALVLWRAAACPTRRLTAQARQVLRLAILSMFFFSGLQKLVHGQFISGEYLLRAIVFESNTMADHLRFALAGFQHLPERDVHELLLHPVVLNVRPQLHTFLRVLSVGIVAAELVVPILVVFRVRGARWALLATQIGIGLVSGEADFALTATGLVLLLWSVPPRASWIAAFVGWAGVAVLTAG